MKKPIIVFIVCFTTQLQASQALFKMQTKLSSKKIMSYDQSRRFIWTCYESNSYKLEKNSHIVLQNSPLCLCQPGGEVDGIGLHVSHVKGINLNSAHHIAYQEIFLENQQCQSFAAYSQQ